MNKNYQYGLLIIVVAFALNWISVWAFSYPFVYCWTRWPVMHLIAPYYYGVWIVALFYFVYALFRFGIGQAFFQALAIAFLVAVIPQWLDTLWRLGKSC